MAAFTYTFKWDSSGPILLFGEMLPRLIPQALKKGAANAALRLQARAREELRRMIYDTPESPNYRRTGTLYRATYVARPGANHSNDHDAAFAGVDLAVTAPAAGGIVRLDGWEASFELGSWAKWANFVHEGYGPEGPRPPKPFLAAVKPEFERTIIDETNKALAAVLNGIR